MRRPKWIHSKLTYPHPPPGPPQTETGLEHTPYSSTSLIRNTRPPGITIGPWVWATVGPWGGGVDDERGTPVAR